MSSITFIYILRLTSNYTEKNNWTNETREIVSEHFNHLKHLKDNGQVLLAGKTDYDVNHLNNFGIVIFQAKDLVIARDLMKKDPAIQAGIMSAELHPFSLSLIVNQ